MTVNELIKQLNKLARRNRQVVLRVGNKIMPLDNIQYSTIKDKIVLVAPVEQSEEVGA